MPHDRSSRIRFVALLSLTFLPALAQAGVLTDILIAKLGVSQPQADGGAGSIFKLARAQMTAANFQKLQTVVPGLDGYLGAAPAFLPNEAPVVAAHSGAGQTAALAGLAGGGSANGAALAGLAGGGSAKGAALAGLAGGGSAKSAALAGLAGGSSAKGAALAGLAGGGSATGALAAAMGQTPSPTNALKGAARNPLSQSSGGVVPGGQGGIAAGALGANAGGSPVGNAATALLAGSALGDQLQAAQALAPAFQQLGMDQGMVARFLPVVIDYVKSVGGKSSSRLLTHALGF